MLTPEQRTRKAIGEYEAAKLDAQRYRKLQDFFGGATPEEWGELHSHPDLNTAVDALITE